MEKKEEKKVCCICGKEYEGYGYNPFPVKEEGCCVSSQKMAIDCNLYLRCEQKF